MTRANAGHFAADFRRWGNEIGMQARDNRWGIPEEMLGCIYPIILIAILAAFAVPHITRRLNEAKQLNQAPPVALDTTSNTSTNSTSMQEDEMEPQPAGGAYVAPEVKFPRKSGHTDKLDLQGSTDKEGVSWPRRSGQRAIP